MVGFLKLISLFLKKSLINGKCTALSAVRFRQTYCRKHVFWKPELLNFIQNNWKKYWRAVRRSTQVWVSSLKREFFESLLYVIVGFTVNSRRRLCAATRMTGDNLRSRLLISIYRKLFYRIRSLRTINTIYSSSYRIYGYELLNLIKFDSESLILAQSERWRRG